MTDVVWVALISAGTAVAVALMTQFLATRAASTQADRAERREERQWQRTEALRREALARADLTTPEEKQAERVQMRKRLHDCFAANPDEVAFTTLAAAVMPSNLQDFVDFVRTGPQAADYQINDTFTPHKATYTKIRRITGKIGASVSVGFDVADVQAGRVYYDATCDGVVLKSPSQQMKQAILENANPPD